MSSLPEPDRTRQILPRTPDEWISFGRLLFAPILWGVALAHRPRLVAAGIVLSAISDMADGFVSRLRGSRSQYSRQLDAIADSAIMLSAIGWLRLLDPASFRRIRATLIVLAPLAAGLLAIEWRRYRMLGALHLDSARAAAVVGHLYVLDALGRGVRSTWLVRLFQMLLVGAVIESAWIILGNHVPADRSPRPLLRSIRRAIAK